MTNKDTGAVTESILIGRATGNVGAELVKQLAASGKRVKAFVRSKSKAASIKYLHNLCSAIS